MAALRLLPIAYFGFIALGLPEGTLGVAWPSMRTDLGRSLAELAVVLVVWTAGYMASTAANGPLTHRFGTGKLLVASAAGTGLSLLGVAATPTWIVLLAATFGVGASGGLIDAGLNGHAARLGRQRTMGFLHASFGIGATLGPLLMAGALMLPGTWRTGYALVAAVQLPLAALLWRTRRRWDAGTPVEASARPRPTSHRTLMLGLAVFFLYTGVEVAAGQWSFSLLTEARGVGEGTAGVLVAAYWACLTAGRFALGVLGDRLPPAAVVRTGMLGVLAGAALLWVAEPVWLGAGGLLLLGAALAPVFPSLMVLTPTRLGNEYAPWAVGYQLAAASLGAAAIPGLIGLTVAWNGLETVAPVLLGTAVAMLTLNVALQSTDRGEQPAKV